MTTPHCAAGCDDPACDRNPAPDRPACPACKGDRVVGPWGQTCTCCDDGTMRGIDDPTPEEVRIETMSEQLRRLEAENAELRRRLRLEPGGGAA